MVSTRIRADRSGNIVPASGSMTMTLTRSIIGTINIVC